MRGINPSATTGRGWPPACPLPTERRLAGGERREPPDGRGTTTHPGRGCRASRSPCRGAFVYSNIPGGSLRSPPAKLPAPFQGARTYLGKYVAVFMKSCTKSSSSNNFTFWREPLVHDFICPHAPPS